MATPDFILDDKWVIGSELGWQYSSDSKVIPKGTFVRPIKFEYLPSHITKDVRNFDKKHYVFCYTPIGIHKIPKKLIRQVSGSKALDINSY